MFFNQDRKLSAVFADWWKIQVAQWRGNAFAPSSRYTAHFMASVEKCESCNALAERRGKSEHAPRPSSSRLAVGFFRGKISWNQKWKKFTHHVTVEHDPHDVAFLCLAICSIQLKILNACLVKMLHGYYINHTVDQIQSVRNPQRISQWAKTRFSPKSLFTPKINIRDVTHSKFLHKEREMHSCVVQTTFFLFPEGCDVDTTGSAQI